MTSNQADRRSFLANASRLGLAATVGLALPRGTSAGSPLLAKEATALPLGKADSCIFIWLGGGAAQMDTWDPKRKSSGKKDPGSYYEAIETAVPGVKVCEHLKQMAPLLDRCALIRSVHHEVVDEHAAATNRLHTGRPTAGTIVYPSIGSIVAHERGSAATGVPAYVVIGYPNVARGPGFLGAKHSYIYLTDTTAGPAGLRPAPEVTAERHARRAELRAKLSGEYLERTAGDKRIAAYAAAAEEGFKLAGPKFQQVFQLDSEPDSLRSEYGDEFGQRCLLARRLVEEGTRFVEVSFNLNFVNGTGWDTHNEGQLNQHLLIQQLDQSLSALIRDLEKRNRLERTLIVVATEFGRPPEFDGRGGRGHQSKAFTCVLAGGGLRMGRAIGVTDDLAKSIVERPVSVPDLHATIHAALGIDPHKELYDGERPVPITDRGTPIGELFA